MIFLNPIYPVKPKDGIAEFLSHMAFGASKIAIAVALGDERLFHPNNLKLELNKIPNAFYEDKPLNDLESYHYLQHKGLNL